MITDIRVKHGPVPSPDIDWKAQSKHWLSLTTAKHNGGFVFADQFLSVEGLFSETPPVEDVLVVEMPDGRLGILKGGLTIARALLAGRAGVEARFYRP